MERYFKYRKKKKYFIHLKNFIKLERKRKIIFPIKKFVFRAFLKTSFKNIKVVIIGQDPYHKINQADGLAFSVPDFVSIPPSLRNIFLEIQKNFFIKNFPVTGNLENWANQGVFLLNSILTVRQDEPGSHKDIGWEIFTDNIVRYINDFHKDIVFILWGNFAKKKSKLISSKKHTIFFSSHPSPLSAHRGFFGCKHFYKTNLILVKKGKTPIFWL